MIFASEMIREMRLERVKGNEVMLDGSCHDRIEVNSLGVKGTSEGLAISRLN